MKTLDLLRDTFSPTFSLGRLTWEGKFIGYTCEDADRSLESGGIKLPRTTAIPRGEYPVVLSFSHRFQRIMPEVLNVPQFSGVRIHAGNTSEDTEGCILLGATRIETGCANCAPVLEVLKARLEEAENLGETVMLTVR